ncbi:MAG: FAD-dependent oxidoreductase [Chloroflexia bacterium]|nr:FAD-dependent oxidoreductase [Chloroflexia bacterium]
MAAIRKIPVSVKEIIPYSDNVRLYRLSPKRPGIQFKAGQFLHLAIEPYDPSFNWPESRVFSIANSPTRVDTVDILVSKIGGFTNDLFNNVKIDDELWIKLPYGIFNFDESMDHDTVLIAGGTGVSPYISFLQYAIDKNLNPAIHLNYGVRSNELIIIKDLIKEAESKLNNFNYKLFVEQPDDDSNGLNIIKGQLQVKEIVADSLKLSKPVFYLSGPPAMIMAFDEELKNQGVSLQQIKYDNGNK